MLRKFAVVAAFVTLLSACSTSGGGDERQVLVDFSPDNVAVFVAKYFPAKVTVTPGQTVAFHQTWTGEPHTITGGAFPSEALRKSKQWFALFDSYTELAAKNTSMVNPDDPGDATFQQFAAALKAAKPAATRDKVLADWRGLRAAYPDLPDIDNPPDMPFSEVNDLVDRLSASSFGSLPSATDDNDNINQNVARPCYLKTGAPPEDPNQSCTAAQRHQPAFDGKYAFYNSGVIPYDGPRGNTYRMKIATTTKPGKYFFYCAIHGPDQSVEVDVVKPGTKTPSASTVAHQGRQEAEAVVAPMVAAYRTAVQSNAARFHGSKIKGPFAGLPTDIHGSVNEFVPRTLHVKAGAPITWKVSGAHTISFDVPAYFPILEFSANKVRFNPKTRRAAGGATPPPADQSATKKIDGGTYDGTGFWSSGLVGNDSELDYTLRITKPGTYNYACLVHPQMIGQIVVS